MMRRRVLQLLIVVWGILIVFYYGIKVLSEVALDAANYDLAKTILFIELELPFVSKERIVQIEMDIAYCYSNLRNYSAAAEWYYKVIELENRNIHALYYYAKNQERVGKCKQALDAISDAIDIRAYQLSILYSDPTREITMRSLYELRYFVYICLDSTDLARKDSLEILHLESSSQHY